MRSRILLLTAVIATGFAAAAAGGSGDVIAAWNEEAYEIAFAEDQFLTFKGQRAMALMHLAMHDAVNAIESRYEPYACRESAEGVPAVAAATAAHRILSELYPDQKSRLDAALERWAPTAGRSAGAVSARRVGTRCAEQILTKRDGDRWDEEGTYAFRSSPGSYRTSPEWNGFMLQPGFRYAKPIALERPDQFRPPPPPALDSERYQVALREVQKAGAKEKSSRSPEQNGYAVWWMEFSEGSVARLVRALIAERRVDLPDAARLFALLHTSLYDTYVAVWDSKYEYNHWRPATAIHETGDPDWEAMLPAPPFPEYVSAHAGGCAASFSILEKTFGPDVEFTMKTITAPESMPSRRFSSFRAAAEECADSRIRLGWHFRYATDAGLTLGHAVADYVAERYLAPTASQPAH